MRITAENSQQIGRKIVQIEPKFKEVVSKFGPAPIGVRRPSQNNFEALADSILSQQLSTKAAATIIARVASLCGGRLDPIAISSKRRSQLRKVGCSLFEIHFEMRLEIPPGIPLELSLNIHLEIPFEIPSESVLEFC